MIPFLLLQTQGAAPSGTGLSLFVVQLVLIVGIFWFVLIRPQQRERKRLEEAVLNVKRGDEIVTSGGIIGEVVHVQLGPAAEGAEPRARMDDRVTIKSGESRLVIERGRIARVVPKGS
jgi:preprotein translocase subunit YajC